MAILNSKLANYWYHNKYPKKGDIFPEIRIGKLNDFKILETNNQTIIIGLVEKILSLKSEDPHADTSAYESEIDQIVYNLYGLTAEEIRVVEGN